MMNANYYEAIETKYKVNEELIKRIIMYIIKGKLS